jgi:hypothetical protein
LGFYKDMEIKNIAKNKIFIWNKVKIKFKLSEFFLTICINTISFKKLKITT